MFKWKWGVGLLLLVLTAGPRSVGAVPEVVVELKPKQNKGVVLLTGDHAWVRSVVVRSKARKTVAGVRARLHKSAQGWKLNVQATVGLAAPPPGLYEAVALPHPRVRRRAETLARIKIVVPWSFSKSRPTLIVLLHGQTSVKGQEQHFGPSKADVGTLGFARDYWGYPFVQGLVGGSTMHTASGWPLSATNWHTEVGTNLENGGNFLLATQAWGTTVPSVSVLLSTRRGDVRLGEQVRQTIKQIQFVYKYFPGDVEPQIVMVAHSMGGLVGRCILTNPAGAIGQGGVTLTDSEREYADLIRDRTVCLITLQSPHRGSPLADIFWEESAQIDSLYETTNQWILALYATLSTIVPVPQPWNAVSVLAEFAYSNGMNSGATRDLRQPFWTTLNGSILHPNLARRTDESLVPIYCTGGRDPGSGQLTRPNEPAAGADWTAVPAKEAQQFLLSDALVRAYKKQNAWHSPPADRILDRVQRIDWITGVAYVPTRHNLVGLAWVEAPNVEERDGVVDSDGMVDMDSAMLWGITPRPLGVGYFDHSVKMAWIPGKPAMWGSWYRRFEGPWQYTNHETGKRSVRVAEALRDIATRAGPDIGPGPWSTWPE